MKSENTWKVLREFAVEYLEVVYTDFMKCRERIILEGKEESI